MDKKLKEKLIRGLPEFNKTQLKKINKLFELYLFYNRKRQEDISVYIL